MKYMMETYSDNNYEIGVYFIEDMLNRLLIYWLFFMENIWDRCMFRHFGHASIWNW